MDIKRAWKLMRAGRSVARSSWKGRQYLRQAIPARTGPAPTTPSRLTFVYESQGDAMVWFPSGDDIMADDWEVV